MTKNMAIFGLAFALTVTTIVAFSLYVERQMCFSREFVKLTARHRPDHEVPSGWKCVYDYCSPIASPTGMGDGDGDGDDPPLCERLKCTYLGPVSFPIATHSYRT